MTACDCIDKYIEAIGGLHLVRSIRRHELLCSIEAKGIQQTWKEFYDYETHEFEITVEAYDKTVMITKGDGKTVTRSVGHETYTLSEKEASEILLSIKLIPETEISDLIRLGKLEAILTEDDQYFHLTFDRLDYSYKYRFDKNTFLKKDVLIRSLVADNVELVMVFSDWREVNGLLFPFKQEMVNEVMESEKIVERLIVFSEK